MPVNAAVDQVAQTVADPWIAGGIMLFVVAMLFLSLIGRGEVRTAPTEERLDQLDKRLTTHDVRLTAVEERQIRAENGQAEIRKDIAKLPTKESVDGLSTQVSELRLEVGGIKDAAERSAYSIRRVEEFLMNAAADVISGKTASAAAPKRNTRRRKASAIDVSASAVADHSQRKEA